MNGSAELTSKRARARKPSRSREKNVEEEWERAGFDVSSAERCTSTCTGVVSGSNYQLRVISTPAAAFVRLPVTPPRIAMIVPVDAFEPVL